ncbi:lyase [Thalassomonas sp. M1454]|uniref:Vgb family protein n=1 Tax=Thalassomonas sp. M1454 TaxID=2594477 RepID=UPI001180E7E5|nr:lyase [Thalassomonas sp. M1454]TRX55746.1 lyase [Thalassomonas sp. M1454]
MKKLLLILFILFICLFICLFSSNLLAEQKIATIEIKEWQVPWPNTRPRDPAIDSSGIVWFCGQSGNYIANLDPNTGKFKRFELSDNTHPHNLIIDSKDRIWYAGNRNSHIGLLDPKTGTIEKIAMPVDTPIDPHTLVFNSQQDIWFTAQWGNKIGFLDTETKQVKLIDVGVERARPYGIKVDYDDVPWVVLFGTNKIAKVNVASLSLEIIDLLDVQERPRRLEISQNNGIFYLDHKLGYLGKFNPDTKILERWLMPEIDKAKLYGSAIDDNDRVWLALTGVKPNKLRVFDSNSKGFITSQDIPSGGGSIRYMYYHQASDAIWFGSDANTIGRAILK